VNCKASYETICSLIVRSCTTHTTVSAFGSHPLSAFYTPLQTFLYVTIHSIRTAKEHFTTLCCFFELFKVPFLQHIFRVSHGHVNFLLYSFHLWHRPSCTKNHCKLIPVHISQIAPQSMRHLESYITLPSSYVIRTVHVNKGPLATRVVLGKFRPPSSQKGLRQPR
jgi:hypothetical protein